MANRPRRGAPAAALTTLVALFAAPGAVQSDNRPSPTIRLFPTTVIEDIRETGDVAREMESGLQQIVARLDQQQQLFEQSKCEGSSGLDGGCAQISRQLGETYLEMLSVMADRLPAMEQAVQSTRNSLERRLRAEIGQGMTPWQLQELLAGPQAGDKTAARPAMRGRTGMRLSDRFGQYYRLVAHAGAQGSSSLAVIAADIYLDMREASDLIAHTRQEISRARLMEELNQSLGSITPEMQEVVAGVKSILFGEEQTLAPIASPPPSARQAYRSPLQL